MNEPVSSELTLRLFGPMEVCLDGGSLPSLRTRKGSWLLALLALYAAREVDRDWLTAMLWPESVERDARASLRVSLSDLRRALGTQADRLSVPTPRALRLDVAVADVDALAFDAAIVAGDVPSLERAVALYRGPFLDGCSQEWAFRERQPREQAFLGALETLAARANSGGDSDAAERSLRRAIATDPLRESAHRRLMELLAATGRHAAAVQVYRDLRLLLHREINAAPDPETVVLFEALRIDRRTTSSTRRSSPATHPSPRHNLPSPITSFVGRDEEIARLRELLGFSHGEHSNSVANPPRPPRMVTVTGAGGCGKSRLALETTWRLLDAFPRGVWWVELAALSDPGFVPRAVADALGIREGDTKPLVEALVAELKGRRLLLVLDNCEHLLSACTSLVDALLRGCPELRVVATSREPLSILGETTYRIPPLPSPDAVQLFVERAVAAAPSFALTEANEGCVTEICRCLDGIPLALEMAAARLRALSVETLASRLDDRFRLLTDGNRAALPRHRTLRAMIDWSHDLLSESEQVLLRRLAVFAGGWTLEAAEAVASGQWSVASESNAPSQLTTDHWPLTTDDVLDLLTKLVDKSLVLYENTGAGRYRLLETMRQFARERLDESGETDEMQRRHAEYYVALAEEAEPQLIGEKQSHWLGRLEPERGNLRAALGWAVADAEARPESDAAVVGLRLAGAVHRFWFIRGDFTEGRGWLTRLLDLSGGGATCRAEVAPEVRAKAFYAAGTLAYPVGDSRAARMLHEQSLALAQEVGDRLLIARSLLGLGTACALLAEYDAARSHFEECLAISHDLGDKHTLARLYNNLSIVIREQGDYERSRALLHESLRCAREAGDRQSTGPALGLLGALCMIQGDFADALAYFEESLGIARSTGDPRNVATISGWMGGLARRQHELVTAREWYRESIRIDHSLRRRWGLEEGLIGLACVEVMCGEVAGQHEEHAAPWLCRGTRLFGAAETLLETIGRVIWAHDRADHERCVAVARSGLGEAAFAAAWAEGRAMTLEEASELALQTEPSE